MTTTALPIHPHTGLTAIGLRRDGRPIWPVAGGAPDDPPPADPPKPPAPPADPPKPGDPPKDEPLGEGGKKALDAEREGRKAAEKEAARLKKIVDDADTAKLSDVEKATKAAADAQAAAATATATAARWKVIAETQLPPELQEFLPEGIADEAVLKAKADKLMAAMAASGKKTGGTPKPDPSQGPKGDPPAKRSTSLTAAIGKALKPAED
jgi:hypothetical protein